MQIDDKTTEELDSLLQEDLEYVTPFLKACQNSTGREAEGWQKSLVPLLSCVFCSRCDRRCGVWRVA